MTTPYIVGYPCWFCGELIENYNSCIDFFPFFSILYNCYFLPIVPQKTNFPNYNESKNIDIQVILCSRCHSKYLKKIITQKYMKNKVYNINDDSYKYDIKCPYPCYSLEDFFSKVPREKFCDWLGATIDNSEGKVIFFNGLPFYKIIQRYEENLINIKLFINELCLHDFLSYRCKEFVSTDEKDPLLLNGIHILKKLFDNNLDYKGMYKLLTARALITNKSIFPIRKPEDIMLPNITIPSDKRINIIMLLTGMLCIEVVDKDRNSQILIARIFCDSPAYYTYIKAGDFIKKINGIEINNLDSMVNKLSMIAQNIHNISKLTIFRITDNKIMSYDTILKLTSLDDFKL